MKLLKGGSGGDPENYSGNVKVINTSIDDTLLSGSGKEMGFGWGGSGPRMAKFLMLETETEEN